MNVKVKTVYLKSAKKFIMENDFAQKKEDVPMATTLKRYFPMLKERETLLAEIQSKN